MNTFTNTLIFGLAFFLFACSSPLTEESEYLGHKQRSDEDISPSLDQEMDTEHPDANATVSANVSSQFISSSAAVVTDDTTRRFIRTANMKFRVKEVAQATYEIEDLTKHFDGFVTHSHLKSQVNRKETKALSADSSLETKYYTVLNNMTLRVPNIKLDTVLKCIAKQIDFLDHRTITARDVSLDILSNKLKQERAQIPDEQRHIVIEGDDREVIRSRQSQDSPLKKHEMRDEAKLATLSLIDRIEFSTINLSIYEREKTKRWVIPNEKSIDEYKPALGAQLVEAIKFGWSILVAIILFITKLWGLILIGVIIFLLYNRYGHRLKKIKWGK